VLGDALAGGGVERWRGRGLAVDERPVTTVDLTAHRGECDLAALDPGDEEDESAA